MLLCHHSQLVSGAGLRPRPASARTPPRLATIITAATRRSRKSGAGADPAEEEDDSSSSNSSPSSSSAVAPQKTQEQMAKLRALKAAINKINEKHGPNTIMQMTAGAGDFERISSGCLTLDKALGGGYPRGRIMEIYGPEASGKTTLALHAIAEVQKAGGNAFFIDVEHAFDANYAKRVGIDMDALLVCQPDYGEQAFSVMDDVVRSGALDLVVLDSVSALVPRTELEGEFGQAQMGAQARLMSQALRKITSNASKANTTIMFINQLRHKVGVVFGNPEVTSGGNALKYYSSVRLEIRGKDKITEAGKAEPVGNRVRVTVKKNKVFPPFETAEFDIIYGSGISATGCMFDVAKDLGVIEARGSHFYFEGSKLAQGRDNALQFLEDNPDTAARIATATKARMAEAARNGGNSKAARRAAKKAGATDDVIDADEDDDVMPEAFDEEELMDDEALLRELEERSEGM